MKYCYYRAFDNSNTDYLWKSSDKLQQLVEISKEYQIALQSEQGSESHNIKKMVVFVTTAVKYEIIK